MFFRDDNELHGQNASKAGADMVEFAIRSLSTMAFRNPSVEVPGLVPYLGANLTVNWRFFWGLCGTIFVAHSLLCVLVYCCYVKPSDRDSQG